MILCSELSSLESVDDDFSFCACSLSQMIAAVL